jgi:hypothetical protein
MRITYKKLLRSPEKYTIIGIKPGRETPTKARLTSLKTPEATLSGARKGLGLPKSSDLIQKCAAGTRGFSTV